jgi:endonuclease VIII
MPEGHTLHRLALDHRKWLAGEAVHVTSPQGRFREGAAALDGQLVTSVEAWGKHLFYGFEGGELLHVHLGLFGRFRRHRQPAPPPRGQVRLRLETNTDCIDLSGPTACELLEPDEHAALLGRLGPDLLRKDASRQQAWARVKASSRTLGALLLDQSVLSGVGNVYRAEGLFVAGLHPELRGDELEARDFTRLWKTLVGMLEDGVRDRKIVTVKHLDQALGRKPRRDERTYVYKRRECRRCGDAIRTWELANRTMYACETCQRR